MPCRKRRSQIFPGISTVAHPGLRPASPKPSTFPVPIQPRRQASAAARPKVTRLQTIYRQGERSEIITTAHAILEGATKPPVLVERLEDVDPASDFTFVNLPEAELCLGQLVRLCARALPYWYPELDRLMDVQVLAPMHKGVCGIGNLNEQLREALNPGAESLQALGNTFAVGDKVIQTRNNYDKGLFNGDLGRVLSIDSASRTLTAEFDGDPHLFESGELSELAPAYAISIHKSQGSEFPVVVMPLLKAHFVLLQRNLLYTGITRGRRKVFVLGDPAAYAMAVRNAQAAERHTGLRGLLASPEAGNNGFTEESSR